MGLSEEKYVRLQRFIDMEMTEVEVYAFEKELEEDAVLKEQWQFEMGLRDAFLEREIREEDESVQHISPKALNGFVWWKPVAAASILILISLLLLQPGKETGKKVLVKQAVDTLVKKNPDSNLVKTPLIVKDSVDKLAKAEALFKKYYKKEPPPNEYPIELADAFERYAVGDYSGFDKLDADNLGELRSGQDRNKTRELVLFYKGVVAMEMNNWKVAEKYFASFNKTASDRRFIKKSNFFQGLLHLKQNNTIEAIINFRLAGDDGRIFLNDFKK